VLFSVRQSARKSNLILAFTIVLILISMVCKWRYYQASHNMTLVAWDQNIKSVVVFRLDSFYIGVLCAWMYLNYRSFCINNCKVLFLIGALLMVFLYVGVGYFHFFIDAQPFFWEVLYLPLTSIAISLLFPFFLQLTSRSKLINRFSTFGAKISYSLFLVHYSILLQIFNQYLMFSNTTVTVFLIFSAFYLLTALLVSYVLYRFYELPLFRISTKS
jgi:peptidoglycan/LPS O-acetylase OafA/YrhL